MPAASTICRGTQPWVNANTEVANRVAYFSLWFSNTVSFQLKSAGGRTYSHFFGSSLTTDNMTPERIEQAAGRHGRLVWLTEDGETPQLILAREILEMK